MRASTFVIVCAMINGHRLRHRQFFEERIHHDEQECRGRSRRYHELKAAGVGELKTEPLTSPASHRQDRRNEREQQSLG
jgi:hypothetical protein